MATTDNDYKLACDAALTVAYNISPTGNEQAEFSMLLNTLRKDSALSNKLVLQQMLDSILDGVRHGNWPKVDKTA